METARLMIYHAQVLINLIKTMRSVFSFSINFIPVITLNLHNAGSAELHTQRTCNGKSSVQQPLSSPQTAKSRTMSITSCDYCHKDHANLKCSKCKCVYYCSQACQKKDWKDHKKWCDGGDAYFTRFGTKRSELSGYLDVLAGALSSECAICLDKIREKPLALPCHHVFCERCLVEHQLRSGQESLFCPLCRKELPKGLFTYIYDNATYFVHMAERIPGEKEHFHTQARRELNVLLVYRTHVPEIQALNAALLCLEGKYQEAISASQAIMKKEPHSTHSRQIHNLVNAHMGMHEYHVAMQYLHQMWRNPNSDGKDDFFANTKGSECMYHLGAYQESVTLGYSALESNRHCVDVHKWIALSQKALGQWDEAVLTMRRAVRYETPWNALHTQRCQALLNQLLSEQQELQRQLKKVDVGKEVK